MTALFFGSFNPPHKGHTAVVKYLLDKGIVDEVMLVVSPHNPLKDSDMLAPEAGRLAMTKIAIEEEGLAERVVVSDIEFGMARPSYTIDTLDKLKNELPEKDFVLLIGADILPELHKWKEVERLLAENRFIVYPRLGFEKVELTDNMSYIADAPTWDFSSTQVRKSRAADMIANGVAEYINNNKLWI